MVLHRASAFCAAVVLAACGGQARGPEGSKLPEPAASAGLFDSSGTRVGLATFSVTEGTAQLGVSVSGLAPGEHGMHIHENGACTPPGFESAGGHFNPGGKKHGTLNPEGPHAGDLPNLVAGPDGSADTTFAVSSGLLAQGPGSMVGPQKRAFVIHAGPDDQKTDPSGNSGARVVCGVIERR
ncbi:MAG TPA: superoxide dismutase family protein [Gemmatimonadales bacterium]|jgi:Cu-Zn family superoxide dismutase|nr:superoxide dismutase family protein [Gemmatimonadales bacterium]